jgi:hypothetical protein
VLTCVGKRRRPPDFAEGRPAMEEKAGSGQHGDGVPEVARRREQSGYGRLVLVELRALSSSHGGASLRRIDGVNAGSGGA